MLFYSFFLTTESNYNVFTYSDQPPLEDATHTTVLTLEESFEGQRTENSIEMDSFDREQFRRLTSTEIKDYLIEIA